MKAPSIRGVIGTRQTTMLFVMPKKEPATELDVTSGRRLRAVREVFDADGTINQEYFAGKIGVTRTALANWESGRLPDVRAMVRLYRWLGVPLEWVYLGELRQVPRDLAGRLERWAATEKSLSRSRDKHRAPAPLPFRKAS